MAAIVSECSDHPLRRVARLPGRRTQEFHSDGTSTRRQN